jgi:hypothetical protein
MVGRQATGKKKKGKKRGRGGEKMGEDALESFKGGLMALASERDRFGLLVREKADVAKVLHEGVRLPAQEKFNLGFSETAYVKDDASTDTQGVGRPTSDGLFVLYGIKIVNSDGGSAHVGVNLLWCDTTDGSVRCTINREGNGGMVPPDQTDVAAEDVKQSANWAEMGALQIGNK